jgi:transcriptional regulator with XRE-family HTH domain/tetratricopeptide (TPR) repeat protein
MVNEKLRQARQQKRWSQAVAAEEVGVSELTYSRWENGTQKPYLKTLDDLCNAFEMSPADLGFGNLAGTSDLVRTLPTISPDTSVDTDSFTSRVLIQSSRAMQPLPGEPLPADSATWFSEKLVQIVFVINQWRGRVDPCTDLQKMLDWELTMFDEILPFYDSDEFHLSRRNALLVIAALPKGLLVMAQRGQNAGMMQAELLPSCAASVTACWHLMKGKEIAAVERALSRYFSLLLTWAKQSSKHQRTAAYFAAQSCMLMGLVELHRSHFLKWLSYCQQAVEYAKISRDRTLHVYTLVFLGSAFKENGKLAAMLQTHQEAARYLDEVAPLVRSKVLAELARSHARNGQVQEALRYIHQAREVFPGEVDDVPCFVSADCGLFQLILLEGLTHLDLGEHKSDDGYYQKAWDALAEIEAMPANIVIPDRLRLEVTNQRALAAVKVGNREKFREHLIEGVNGAKAIGSEKRRQEAIVTYREARLKWPHESQILELADMLV